MLEENLHLARLWYEEMWSKPDYDLADKLVDPIYKPDWVQIEKTGPDQIKHEIRYFRSVFPDLRYSIIDILASDDRVWIRYKGVGTQSGSAWGFSPTNKQVDFEGASILYINTEGRVVDRWGAFCFYDILTDLKLTPPLWELNERLKGKS